MTATPRELLERYQRAMLELSADDLADLYAEDAVHEFPFFTGRETPPLRGREAVRASYRAAWAATPVRVRRFAEVAVHATGDPDLMIVEQRIEAENAASGETFSFGSLLVMRTAGGYIAHMRDYVDALGVARGLGRLPRLG